MPSTLNILSHNSESKYSIENQSEKNSKNEDNLYQVFVYNFIFNQTSNFNIKFRY